MISNTLMQLPLRFGYPAEQSFENFVGAPQGALEHLRTLAQDRNQCVYVEGPTGSGKTHLALALCAAAESSGRRTAYLPLKAARGQLGVALESLEDSTVIALDGLEAVAGDKTDETALFDFHNRVRSAGRSVLLYSAQSAPDALALALPDLCSRLAQCSRITLSALNDAQRRAVLQQHAVHRGLTLDAAAVDWLFAHVARDLPSLLALLDWLDRESLSAQRRVTVPFLRKTLAEKKDKSAPAN